MTQELIRIEGLRKQFQKKWALRDITLSVKEGELFGLIGPNGAGKSTLIKILATLEFPTEGTAYIEGLDVRTHPFEIRSRIGYMPELFGLYDELVVSEYLEFFARVYKIPTNKRDSVIADLLELTDLHKMANEEVKNLSKGIRQRLYLAKTLLPNSRVLLLDEPASGLDPRARVEFRAILFELQKAGKTILISSHILSDLQDICNRIAIIEKGKLLVVGDVREIIESMTPFLKVKIRTLNTERETLESLLESFAFKNFQKEGNFLVGEFHGESHDIPKIHRHLVENQVDVYSFQVAEGGLEEVFMSITEGEIS